VGIGTSSPATLLHVSSATGSATPTPTEIRVATTTSATDWSTTSPWGRLSFYSADLTDTGPKIQGALDFVSDTSGGGRGSIVFSSAAATTGTLTERMRIDSSGNLKFDSGYGSVATAYGCRAWVNFNGTGTVAIRASGNVSSITDNSTGNYTVNFTTAMPDVNFCAVASGFRSAGNEACISTDTYAVGSIIINCTGGTGTEGDFSIVNVSIFR
jgi:hypothetical protein